MEERNLFLQQSQTVFIFSAYTDACTSSCKIVIASKRPLIFKFIHLNVSALLKIYVTLFWYVLYWMNYWSLLIIPIIIIIIIINTIIIIINIIIVDITWYNLCKVKSFTLSTDLLTCCMSDSGVMLCLAAFFVLWSQLTTTTKIFKV